MIVMYMYLDISKWCIFLWEIKHMFDTFWLTLSTSHDVLSIVCLLLPVPGWISEIAWCIMYFANIWQEGSRGSYPGKYFKILSSTGQMFFSNPGLSLISPSGFNFSLRSLIHTKKSLFSCSFLRKHCTLYCKDLHPLSIIVKGCKGQICFHEFVDNFFSIYARSFPRRVLMYCQKMDSIESL